MPLELGNKNKSIANEVLIIAGVFLFTILFIVIISALFGDTSQAKNYLEWLVGFFVFLYLLRLIVWRIKSRRKKDEM